VHGVRTSTGWKREKKKKQNWHQGEYTQKSDIHQIFSPPGVKQAKHSIGGKIGQDKAKYEPKHPGASQRSGLFLFETLSHVVPVQQGAYFLPGIAEDG